MMKTILALYVICFVFFCGVLVVESGVFEKVSQTEPGCILLQNVADNPERGPDDATAPEVQPMKAAETVSFGADHAAARTITLGSVDPKSGYEFQLELNAKGAAIRKVTFSRFDNRDRKDPQPLVFIAPALNRNGDEVLAMANTALVFVERQVQLPLDQLYWKSDEPETETDGTQIARF